MNEMGAPPPDGAEEFVAPSNAIENDEKSVWETDPGLVDIRHEVDQITDKLGEPIDQDVKDTVVALKALGLPTSQSCGGHLDRGGNAPWVEVYPTEPETENWQENDELRQAVTEESDKIRDTLDSYLQEFYKDRETSDKTRLELSGVAYGYRVQPVGLEWADGKKVERSQEELDRYRKEMKDFTQFLANKYQQSKTDV